MKPTRAVDLIRAAGSGVVLVLLSTPPDACDPGLADAMFEAVLRELLTDVLHPPEPGPVAAAVALRASTSQLDMLSDAEQRESTSRTALPVCSASAAAATHRGGSKTAIGDTRAGRRPALMPPMCRGGGGI